MSRRARRHVRVPPDLTSLFDVLFTAGKVRDYRDGLRSDVATLRRFNEKLRARGILKGDSKYYVSLAHTDADIEHTLGAWDAAIGELKAERAA